MIATWTSVYNGEVNECISNMEDYYNNDGIADCRFSNDQLLFACLLISFTVILHNSQYIFLFLLI